MSSIMRWRRGLMVGVGIDMAVLLSRIEANCLDSQHREQHRRFSHFVQWPEGYRASGLVHWPDPDDRAGWWMTVIVDRASCPTFDTTLLSQDRFTASRANFNEETRRCTERTPVPTFENMLAVRPYATP